MTLTRDEIHVISRHGKMDNKTVRSSLIRNVYASPDKWKKFVNLLLLTLGIAFTTSGVIFFFAYNWASLHKFIKIGLIETLIAIAVALVIFGRFSGIVKNIILFGASMMVGALFAVFGQVYQTGANAYDFFLGWTIFISIWAIVSHFPALWLLLLILIDTTFVLYIEQVAFDREIIFVFIMLYILTAVPLVLLNVLFYKKIIPVLPVWFQRTVELAVIFFITWPVIIDIFENPDSSWYYTISLATFTYGGMVYYGFKIKNIFYPAIVSSALIVIICSMIIEWSKGAELILLSVSLFVLTSVTVLIKFILSLQKKWSDE